jgi:hypothetical protein
VQQSPSCDGDPVVALNPVLAFVARLKAERERLAALDWTPPAIGDPPEPPGPRRLVWGTGGASERRVTITVDELRASLPEIMAGYLFDDVRDDRAALLVKVAAGGGKSHAGVHVAQAYVRGFTRGRVMWAAQRHDSWDQLAAMCHFEPRLWYHWRSIVGEDEAGEPMCRYREAMRTWLSKGYPSRGMCDQLCEYNRHKSECPYLLQRKRPEPIIFAMHQHLALGVNISGFRAAFVDELPLSAFVEKRLIPFEQIDPGASGPLAELTDELVALCYAQRCSKTPARVSGRALLDRVGPLLGDVYAQVEVLPDALPQVPHLYTAEQAAAAPYWYVMDMLSLLAPEHEAWAAGWDRWAERIWLDDKGLWLLKRAEPWGSLPTKRIVLDATAQADLYERVFGTPMVEYAPRIERAGRIYQVAGRLNGMGTIRPEGPRGQDKAPSEATLDALRLAKQIARRYGWRPGNGGKASVVCSKKVAGYFARDFGVERVETFGALRGSNDQEGQRVMIVVGTVAPGEADVIEIATALSGDRVRPFVDVVDGRERALWRSIEAEYPLTAAGQAAARQLKGGDLPRRIVSGYEDPDLRAVYSQLREAELVQAIHRSRVNVYPVDVWVLSSVPLLGEAVDWIDDDPPNEPDAWRRGDYGENALPWRHWLTLEDWGLFERLERGEVLDNETLAALTGADIDYIRRRACWLEAIAAMYPDSIELATVARGKRGRPPKVARARDTDRRRLGIA